MYLKKLLSTFIKLCNDNQGIIAIISIISAVFLAVSDAMYIAIFIAILLIIFFIISISQYANLSHIKTISTDKNIIVTPMTLNTVPALIMSLPNNKDMRCLYDKISAQAKQWSFDAKFVGSRVYLHFNRNKCATSIMGIIDSKIRLERKKMWVPEMSEYIEEQKFGEIKVSPILTANQFWRLAVIKVLETTTSDIERLEECELQILPSRNSLSISIFFEQLPRRWSRHFELKNNCLYQGKNLVFKFK